MDFKVEVLMPKKTFVYLFKQTLLSPPFHYRLFYILYITILQKFDFPHRILLAASSPPFFTPRSCTAHSGGFSKVWSHHRSGWRVGERILMLHISHHLLPEALSWHKDALQSNHGGHHHLCSSGWYFIYCIKCDQHEKCLPPALSR